MLKKRQIAAANEAVHVTSRAAMELARIVITLARSDLPDVMCSADAESALNGIRSCVEKGAGKLGPAHFLTAPLTPNSLPLMCQELAKAALGPERSATSSWDGNAWLAADLAAKILDDPKTHAMVRHNAVDTAGCAVLGILATGRVQPYQSVIGNICRTLIQLAQSDDGRLDAAQTLSTVLLGLYGSSEAMQSPDLREILVEAGEAIGRADNGVRVRLAPIARQLGAIALHRGDEDLAKRMAKASVPAPPSRSRQLRTQTDAFQLSAGLRLTSFLGRPGLEIPVLPNDYLDDEAQRAFLGLERQEHP